LSCDKNSTEKVDEACLHLFLHAYRAK